MSVYSNRKQARPSLNLAVAGCECRSLLHSLPDSEGGAAAPAFGGIIVWKMALLLQKFVVEVVGLGLAVTFPSVVHDPQHDHEINASLSRRDSKPNGEGNHCRGIPWRCRSTIRRG